MFHDGDLLPESINGCYFSTELMGLFFVCSTLSCCPVYPGQLLVICLLGKMPFSKINNKTVSLDIFNLVTSHPNISQSY